MSNHITVLTRTRTAQTRQQHVSPSRPLEGSTFSGERAASLPGPLASLTPRSQPPGPKLRFPSNHSNNVVPSAPSFWDFSWRSLPCSSFVLRALPGGLWLRCSPPAPPRRPRTPQALPSSRAPGCSPGLSPVSIHRCVPSPRVGSVRSLFYTCTNKTHQATACIPEHPPFTLNLMAPPPPPPTLRGSVGCKKITGHFQVSPFFKGFYFLDTDTSTILLRPRQGTGLRSLLQAEPAPPAPQALIINFGAHVKKHKHKAALGRRSTNNSALLGGERQDFHLSPPPAPHSISHCL